MSLHVCLIKKKNLKLNSFYTMSRFLSLDNITAHFRLTMKNYVIFYSHQSSFCSFAFLFKRIKSINPIEVKVIDNSPNN